MRAVFLLFSFFVITSLQAKKIDYMVLKNITGSKWSLSEEKKAGGIFTKANKAPLRQELVFTTGSLLFDSDDQHYQCDYTLKKKTEFWLYCSEPDQYIYKIKALSRNELVMDMLVKTKSGKFVKTKRLTYKRVS